MLFVQMCCFQPFQVSKASVSKTLMGSMYCENGNVYVMSVVRYTYYISHFVLLLL